MAMIVKHSRAPLTIIENSDINPSKNNSYSQNRQQHTRHSNSIHLNKIMVHVRGEVHNPGLYLTTPNSRVIDVIHIAGGPTQKADLHKLNLAKFLKDGNSVKVPSKKATEVEKIVPINVANETQLQLLPGVGPQLAKRIIQFRSQNGPFSSIDDLKNVPGIGKQKLQAIKERYESHR